MAEQDGPQTNNHERPTTRRSFSAMTPLTIIPPAGQIAHEDSGGIAPGYDGIEQPRPRPSFAKTSSFAKASEDGSVDKRGQLQSNQQPGRLGDASLPHDPFVS